MFNIFKKKKTQEILALCDGTLLPIEKCRDEAFALKMMGDGFVIIPSSPRIYAPVSGVIKMVFPTGHAIGIEDENHNEYLIHLGIDTTQLSETGFIQHVALHDKVKAGQLLVEMDLEKIRAAGYFDDVIVVLPDQRGCVVKQSQQVVAKEVLPVEILEVKK